MTNGDDKKTEWYRITYFLPVIVPSVVIATFFTFYGRFLLCHQGGKPCSPLTSQMLRENISEGLEATAASYAASVSWTLVSGVHFLACMLAVLTACIVIHHALGDVGLGKRRLLILLVVVLAVDVSLLVSLKVSADTSSPAQLLLSTTVGQVLPAINGYNRLFDSMSLTATICLAFAACATLWQHRVNEAPTEEDVARRATLLRYVLYVGAALLAMSVLRLSATLTWGASFLTPDSEAGRSVATLVSGISSSLGAYFTLLMLGMYLPAAMLLRGRARRLAEGETAADKDKWLSDRGLALSFADYLPRVIALLGPLLAGPVGELLGHVFGAANG